MVGDSILIPNSQKKKKKNPINPNSLQSPPPVVVSKHIWISSLSLIFAMKNFHEKNQSLQFHAGPENGDHKNDVRSEDDTEKEHHHDLYHQPPPFPRMKSMVNNTCQFKRRPIKYRSLKQILSTRPPPPPPPPSFSSCSYEYSNGDQEDEDEGVVKASDRIDLAAFAFKWGRTDRRERESLVANKTHEFSVENYNRVVHEPAVGYKCGASLKKLLYGMYGREAAAMEDDENDDATSRPQNELNFSEGQFARLVNFARRKIMKFRFVFGFDFYFVRVREVETICGRNEG